MFELDHFLLGKVHIFFQVRFLHWALATCPVDHLLQRSFHQKRSIIFITKHEGETFGVIFLIVFRVFLNLQLANILLKMDGFVGFTWKEVFWPFWIFFSIMIGLSFSILLIMLTKLCTYILFRKDKGESKLQLLSDNTFVALLLR